MNRGLVELQQALTLRLKARSEYRAAFERFEDAVERDARSPELEREMHDARRRFDDAEERIRSLTGEDPPFATRFS